MSNHKHWGFHTKAIHTKGSKADTHRAIKVPIYAGAAFDFENAEALEDAFTGRKPSYTYTRTSNPTVEAFERKMTVLEEGIGAVAFSSGMAAIHSMILTLLQKNENIVASDALFGNTCSLFKNVLAPLGIQTKFVDICDLQAVEQAFDKNTKILFFETISNHPKMNVADVKSLTQIAHEKNAVAIVDSTLTTPYLFQGKHYNADIMIHSSTKYISGGGTAIGGVVIDLGNFPWQKIGALKKFYRFQHFAFLSRLRKQVLRDTGPCMDPHTAWLHCLGLETLPLRIEKSSENALQLATFLQSHPYVKKVHYPGLSENVYYSISKKQFGKYCGGILGFELKNKEMCFKVMNQLQLFRRATNLNDNTSLVIHPASTIFVNFTQEERVEMGVKEEFIRVSVGLENIEDLIEDLTQALDVIQE